MKIAHGETVGGRSKRFQSPAVTAENRLREFFRPVRGWIGWGVDILAVGSLLLPP